MVNFNFGLGGNNSQDDSVIQDTSETQNGGTSDGAVTTASNDSGAPSTNVAKPLTELMTEDKTTDTPSATPDSPIEKTEEPKEEIVFDEESTEEDSPELVEAEKEDMPKEETETKIENPASPEEEAKEEPIATPEPIIEEIANNTTPKTEAPTVPSNSVEEEPQKEAPVNPFAAPNKESKTAETTTMNPLVEEKADTDSAPKVEAPVNPFATPTAPIVKEEEPKETPIEKEVSAPPANPFAGAKMNPGALINEKPESEEKPLEQSMKPFPFSNKPKKETKEEIPAESEKNTVTAAPSFSGNNNEASTTAANDPMKAVGQVKNDIVTFVEFHKKNIQKFQRDITDLEKKIQEEKKLLKDKGDAYSKVLKELQDLTQNFGGIKSGEAPKAQNHPQHKPRNDHRKNN
jgi:hypothetical protein